MHRSLLIDEILSLIIQFVAADGQQDLKRLENASGLARLARTCRCFMECALDILWRTQHSLSPLIMCLPRGTWEIHSSNLLVSFILLRACNFIIAVPIVSHETTY
jgi:hypothetical protein